MPDHTEAEELVARAIIGSATVGTAWRVQLAPAQRVLAALTEAGLLREPFAPRQVDTAALAIPDLTDVERAAFVKAVKSQQTGMANYEMVVAQDMVAWLCRRCVTVHVDVHLGDDDRPTQKGITLADLVESAHEHELGSHTDDQEQP